MAPHYPVLMVGEDSVVLYTKNGGIVISVRWDAPDFKQRITDAFNQHRGGGVILLFNDNGHTYRREDNLSVEQSLQRLEEHFAKMEVRGVMARRTRAANARPGHYDYLFIGLENDLRHGLLNSALTGADVAVVGCSVLPVESTGLVAALAAKNGGTSRWSLLAGLHETGGMRQVVTRDGELALTRILPSNPSNAAAWVQNTVTELQATVNYLRRFGFKDDQGIDMTVIGAESDKRLFNRYVMKGCKLTCLTLQEALAQLNLAGSAPDSRYADALYAAWTERAEKLELYLSVPAGGRNGTEH